VPDLFYLIRRCEYTFRKKKSGRELAVITRRPHRDRDRAMRCVGKSKSYLERLFDRKYIRRVFSHRPCDDTSNGYLRKC
jgi:hypothetical protein